MATAYRGMDQDTLDREYNARASVPDYEAEAASYRILSAAARDALPFKTVAYDPHSREQLDWFPAAPGGPESAPVFLWIHGGYWRALSRHDQSCVAPGLVAGGVHVAVMDYTLVPHATLDEIVRQVRQACAFVAARAGGPVFVGGSSAGGHLGAMTLDMACVRGAVLLSGLYDLEPVRLSHVNGWMQLDAEAAHRNSPIHHIPRPPRVPLLLAYGAEETGEFKRQTDDYAAAYAAAGGVAQVAPQPGRNHFNVAAALGDPADPMCRAALSFIGGSTNP